jgi:hypothetical protein
MSSMFKILCCEWKKKRKQTTGLIGHSIKIGRYLYGFTKKGILVPRVNFLAICF